nr:immunoglobulin light chain junction region [Macaca mulatta]MOX78540.1 immunoglobulin light chain junction region [Macaca mulatta]MOX78584.1 immunoglobulin light chain junction region [Macaca mulatta]MOX80074.1 immunoglobulin light chain junction region [Macaca mulatta]MOX82263.1 immunoglobulin light chain junction region [Macaca mulatta]
DFYCQVWDDSSGSDHYIF